MSVWRKGSQAPKVSALLEVLTAHAASETKLEAPKTSRKPAAKTGSAKAA